MGLKVYTGGTFDLIHMGHVRFLQACKRLAGDDGEVYVSLNTDAFIEAYKGRRPVMSYLERAEVLREFRCVDHVIPNIGGADSKPAIERIRPDFIMIGSDWHERDYFAQMGIDEAWMQDWECGVVYYPYTPGVSTTELKSRILSGGVSAYPATD